MLRRSDWLDRLLDLVKDVCGVPEDKLSRLESRVRNEYGGDVVRYIARFGRRELARRDARILAELERGLTYREVADRVGCAVSTVAKVRKAALCRRMPEVVRRSE